MGKQLIDLNSEISLYRALHICRHFNHMKPWRQLLSMNRRRHASSGEFVPYRNGTDGVLYRLEDILGFISRNVPGLASEQVQEIYKRYEVSADAELDELLHMLDGGSADLDGCYLDDEDFHDALGIVFEVEDGIKRTMDHLVALTKLCEGMAATRAEPDEPTAEYLSSFGWGAINDADKLLFKLQNLAGLLDRNNDQYEDDMVGLGDGLSEEAA